MNLISFDIEEWFIEEKFNGARQDKYVQYDAILSRILDLLEEKECKATFFCLGKIACDFPYVIKRIAERGHEVGCHSNEHLWLTKMTPKELRKDTEEAIMSLEDVYGQKVVSYRAPAFSIGQQNAWAIEILAECGIERDASIFPAVRDFGGFSVFKEKTPCLVEFNGCTLKEFPICTMRILGKEIAYSGGGYFRLFPYSLVKKTIQTSWYAMCYFHIEDFIDAPKKMMSKEEYEVYFKEHGYFINRLKRYVKSNIGTGDCFNKMNHLVSECSFTSLASADRQISWDLVNKVIV